MARSSSVSLLTSVLIFLLLAPSAVLAQFNFNFGNMFNQGGQAQHAQPQNMASDSEWYRTNYDNGMLWGGPEPSVPLVGNRTGC